VIVNTPYTEIFSASAAVFSFGESVTTFPSGALAKERISRTVSPIYIAFLVEPFTRNDPVFS